MKLGKLAATHDKRDLLFSHFETTVPIPKAKVGFGHYALVGQAWGMLGNDEYGDCVWAAADHGTMLWNAVAGRQVEFTPINALADYTAVTGFDPKHPNTDQGTNMRDAFNYRRNTGVVDALQQRHKIDAYCALEPGDWNQLLQGLEVFDLVEIGFRFPDYAMAQFNQGKPWSVMSGHHNIDGGHDVIVVGRPLLNSLLVVTWGKLQLMTRAFFTKYCDEGYGILSEEQLTAGKTPEGFDITGLQNAVAAL